MSASVSPVSLIATNPGISAYESVGSVRTASGSASSGSSDTVTISAQAYRKQIESQIESERASTTNSWTSLFGLESGTTTLENGNTQVVTIDGAKMEIREYAGGVLVRKETGQIAADRVTKDIEEYDGTVALTQKTHVELTGIDDTSSTETMATLRRDVTWYEGGQVVRELHDGMRVEAAYKKLSDLENLSGMEAKTLEDMISCLTLDTTHADYTASIIEYSGGKVSQTANVRQGVDSTNVTNRSDRRVSGMDGHTSRVVSQADSLSIDLVNYDASGEVLREASFTDEVEQGGTLKQSMSVSWYDQGNLVRASQGSLTMEASEGGALPRRATLFEVLEISEKKYSADKPLAAGELLAAGFQETAGDGGAFVDDAADDMAVGGYDVAGNLAATRSMDNPYEVSFASQTYRDGELVAASRDTEEVRKNLLLKSGGFQTGKGLTEDEFPAMLRSSSHEELSYEDGVVSAQGQVSMREFVQKDDRGVYGLYTHYKGEAGVGVNAESLSGTRTGSLEDLDSDADAATSGMGDEVGLVLDDSRELFRRLAS
ncbi:MAG: hypothetical protein GYA47_13045 [Desulfovibrio sp.]|nr:hypothetical protein [Desulfovibrio sp.]